MINIVNTFKNSYLSLMLLIRLISTYSLFWFLTFTSCAEKTKTQPRNMTIEKDISDIQIYERGRTTQEVPTWALGTFTIGIENNQPMIFRPKLNWSGPNAPEGWKPTKLWNPSLISNNGKLFLFYRAGPKLEGMESRIGVAWSENGVDWEDYTKNPVISPTEDYEILGCEYPKIYKYSDIYYMYYNAIWDKTFKKIKGSLITKDNDDLIGVDICLAISKDLLHWEKKGVVVPRSISKNWAKAAVIPRSPIGEAVKINGEFLMYISERPYASRQDTLEQLVGHSKDLIHWEFEKKPFMKNQNNMHSIYEVASATTNFPGSDDLILDVFYNNNNEGNRACAQILYNKNNPYKSIGFSDYGLCTWGGMLVFKDQWIFGQGWVEPEAIYLYTSPISRSWIEVQSMSLDRKVISRDEFETLEVKVENIGKSDGVREIKPLVNGNELKGIKVELKAGESSFVKFVLKKNRPGEYIIKLDDYSCVLEILLSSEF